MTDAGSQAGSVMKAGLIGAGNAASACLVAPAIRGVAREIVVVNRRHEVAEGLVTDLQYGAHRREPARDRPRRRRMTQTILRAEQAAIPAGFHNADHGVTLSLPPVVRKAGVTRVLAPTLNEAGREAPDASAGTLRQAAAEICG